MAMDWILGGARKKAIDAINAFARMWGSEGEGADYGPGRWDLNFEAGQTVHGLPAISTGTKLPLSKLISTLMQHANTSNNADDLGGIVLFLKNNVTPKYTATWTDAQGRRQTMDASSPEAAQALLSNAQGQTTTAGHTEESNKLAQRGAATAERYATEQAGIGREALQLARERAEFEQGIAQSVEDRAQKRWEDWQRLYAPLEEQIVKESIAGVPLDYAAQRAGAGVSQQIGGAREQGLAEMARRGIGPDSPQYQKYMRDLAITEALGRAGSMENARETGRQTNWARKAAALNMGLGLPGQTAGMSATAAGIGPQSQGLYGLGANTIGNAANTSLAGAGLGMQGLNSLAQLSAAQNAQNFAYSQAMAPTWAANTAALQQGYAADVTPAEGLNLSDLGSGLLAAASYVNPIRTLTGGLSSAWDWLKGSNNDTRSYSVDAMLGR